MLLGVQIDALTVLGVIVFGFVGVYGFQFKLYKKVCGLIRIAKRMHPKETKIEGL